jgi:spore coat polysaccharide biosynthesis protein SpsF
MGSSRLPGKVLKDIQGKPMLGWVVERVKRSRKIDQVVVATTLDESDEAIVDFCRNNRIDCFRGDVFDVLNAIIRLPNSTARMWWCVSRRIAR